MRISDWSSDVCSSDLLAPDGALPEAAISQPPQVVVPQIGVGLAFGRADPGIQQRDAGHARIALGAEEYRRGCIATPPQPPLLAMPAVRADGVDGRREGRCQRLDAQVGVVAVAAPPVGEAQERKTL